MDTTALIDFSKRREPAFSLVHRFLQNGEDVGVSPVNVAEFYAGLAPSQHAVWDEFFEPLLLWPISLAAAKQAGRFGYTFARRGVLLSTTDRLVAAVAREQRATIVTSNVKDYPMDEVTLLSLSVER
ncbi:MAG: type II toxin-antitoxin system VapC family toxin [Rubrobacter sp.]|nr:type II toxin-antitoxin system VapC family toxin [Rubrobacter sp.]